MVINIEAIGIVRTRDSTWTDDTQPVARANECVVGRASTRLYSCVT